VAYVDETLDNARLGPVHKRVLAIITVGLFFDVIDFIILGSLVPDMLRTHFATAAGVGTVGTATLLGLFLGTLGQGEFTDRFGRKGVFQVAVACYSLATIAAALAPTIGWLAIGRFVAGVALGAAAPLCFSYAAEYSPKRIRGRVTAFMQFVGGACVWPLGTLLALALRGTVGWRGVWIIIGLGGLAVFAASFRLPESPRWLVTHGRGKEALDQLEIMGLGRPPADETLVVDRAIAECPPRCKAALKSVLTPDGDAARRPLTPVLSPLAGRGRDPRQREGEGRRRSGRHCPVLL
jgi:MFS transporter, putative metabolite:H+ symporter